ncbi:MAG: EamA family transporter [Oscillospiraceae bacterium]|nr:EamA family transporter [Oscillospiraceae bacterium]
MNTTAKNTRRTAMASLASSMFIFGTIGIFVRNIGLPSSLIALVRSVVGLLFLLAVTALKKEGFSFAAMRSKLPLLALSGILMGFNWILLFEAYRYTTVATATLCYYLAPVFLILASPFALKERLTAKKLLCVSVALAGMIPVSGVLQAGFSGVQELKGILLGASAALLYACVVLMNKRSGETPPLKRTMVQMAAAAAVLLPYVLLTEELSTLSPAPVELGLLLVVGVIHTGLAYMLYFGSMNALEAHTLAIFSYIDPIVAILLSALLLHEPLGLGSILGAVLILGAAFVSEQPEKKK